MFLVDSHAHLEFEDYADDLEQVLERACEANVRAVLSVSCVNSDNPGTGLASLVREYSGEDVEIYSAFGVHPHDAGVWDEEYSLRITDLCSLPSCVALGEIGLDYYYLHSPAEAQREVFIRQLEIACALGLPVIIHSRDAEEDTLEILESSRFAGKNRLNGVLHCYTGSVESAARILDLGFCLSFGGIVTFKKSDAMREVVRNIPLERILLETDSPFLAPAPHRGKRNEPSYLKFVAEKIAEIKNVTPEEVAAVTTDNFTDLFLDQKRTGW